MDLSACLWSNKNRRKQYIFFIFGLARVDWDTDVEEVLKLYRSEIKRVKDELEIGNKKIESIEKEIFNCKKRLGVNVFEEKDKF